MDCLTADIEDRMAQSIVATTKEAISSKTSRHIVMVCFLPAVFIALAALKSRGLLHLNQAPGVYFNWIGQFAKTPSGMVILAIAISIALGLAALRKYTFAAYWLSLGWVVYFLRALP